MKIGRQNNTQDCRAPSRADFFVEFHVPFGRYRVGMGFLPKKAGIIKRAALQWAGAAQHDKFLGLAQDCEKSTTFAPRLKGGILKEGICRGV